MDKEVIERLVDEAATEVIERCFKTSPADIHLPTDLAPLTGMLDDLGGQLLQTLEEIFPAMRLPALASDLPVPELAVCTNMIMYLVAVEVGRKIERGGFLWGHCACGEAY